MAALSAVGPWLFLMALFLLLASAFGSALALLSKILATPGRDVRVRVGLFPRPGIEIDVRNSPRRKGSR
ncbi:hypothetical protein GCM10012275_43800 [Longimycelium tulufanense]|uniref:Uncharacterized protein n=1 Tax=Longimycelium tulufanense TaxID=907463 RepID=A0A8J3CES5_9PSEU|nr:hypothetical protein [Longimycelium tulufanense]GGM68585.1 hypothetical protein GCM10012275_43800 [Longimycelium tulufanense]